jgi:DNA-binding transcriptional MocR family regulator
LLSGEQKQYLHALATEQGIPLIENDIYGDLHFSGHRPINIKSLDESGLVLTCSSYSKSLAPGIRLGWLSAGKFFKKAEQIKYALGSTVSPIYQETITKLISSTSYDRHVRLFRNQLASQCYHTQNLINRFFPENTVMSTPAGGSNLWVQMDRKLDMQSFYKLCEETGIRFTPGYTFSFSKAYDQFFRLVFSDKYSAARENALKIAGDTAAKLIRV